MPHRITNNELRSYLERIAKPNLIAWLMRRCQEDEKLRASLLDLATPKENAEALASEIRDRIHQTWQLAKHRDGWKMALPISRELDQVLASIQNLIEKDCPREAEVLLAEFLTMAEHSAEQVDDSYGHLESTCQEAVTFWGEAWARIDPRDTGQLAILVYEHIHGNGYIIRDEMIAKFAKALATQGLRTLQSRLKGDLEDLPQPDPKKKDDFERTRITRWLKQIADALGDVDEYIALVESDQQEQTEAVPIARRLFKAGRLQEALAYIEKCTSRFASSKAYDYPRLKSKTLVGSWPRGGSEGSTLAGVLPLSQYVHLREHPGVDARCGHGRGPPQSRCIGREPSIAGTGSAFPGSGRRAGPGSSSCPAEAS